MVLTVFRPIGPVTVVRMAQPQLALGVTHSGRGRLRRVGSGRRGRGDLSWRRRMRGMCWGVDLVLHEDGDRPSPRPASVTAVRPNRDASRRRDLSSDKAGPRRFSSIRSPSGRNRDLVFSRANGRPLDRKSNWESRRTLLSGAGIHQVRHDGDRRQRGWPQSSRTRDRWERSDGRANWIGHHRGAHGLARGSGMLGARPEDHRRLPAE